MADEEPWFQRYRARFDHELKALQGAGLRYEVDEEARSAGLLVLHVEYPRDGEPPLRLTATYPDSFPYFRPEVSSSDLALARHQNPFGGRLCLLPRPTKAWDPDLTLADLLRERLPLVLAHGQVTDPAEMADWEQAEPVSDYYPCLPGASCLIDPPPSLADLTAEPYGRLVIGLRPDATITLKGAVVAIQDANRVVLAELPDEFARLFPRRIGFRWVRLDRPPDRDAPLDPVRSIRPEALTPPHVFQPVSGGRIDVLGIVFPEEVEPGGQRDGWIFCVRAVRDGRQMGTYLARAARVDPEQFGARIPGLHPLRDAVVSVAGLGCIGAPSVLEFARAGVGELRLLDHDRVDVGATVRWPFGLSVTGDHKAHVLARFIETHYPRTRAVPFVHRIGDVRDDPAARPEGSVLHEFMEGALLLYDAGAEWGVSHFLSHQAREHGIPYVAITGRNGGWGGSVVRDGAGITEGCWGCFEHHRQDGSIEQPPEDPSRQVQPAGCADPTFVGANFDLGEVALGGVRLAVATLCREADPAYPDFDWDLGVVALRTPEGRPIPPVWRTYRLTQHPACERCA